MPFSWRAEAVECAVIQLKLVGTEATAAAASANFPWLRSTRPRPMRAMFCTRASVPADASPESRLASARA